MPWAMEDLFNCAYLQLPRTDTKYHKGSICYDGFTLIPAWINYYINDKVWDEIVYPIPNFNAAAVGVWE